MTMATPLLIDFDPGIDPVVSLFYAARHFDLVQVATTHGNASLTTTTRNALRLVGLGGLTRRWLRAALVLRASISLNVTA
ncbi:nucleoside hydrolase [Mesorhizobium sp. B2-3-13]|nr:nucleoside hydrolase [Mesorhizobium sp. B2-3-13]